MNTSRPATEPSIRPRPIGLWRNLACWLVEHPRTVAGAGIVAWLAMAAGVFRWGMNYMGQADQLPPGLEWLGWVRTWGGWVLGAINVAWLLHARRRCDGEARPATSLRPERPTLSSMMHGRIYERQPVRKELLPLFGWIGAAGVTFGVLLSLWLALATSGGQMEAKRWALILLAGLVLVTFYGSVATLRDTLILANEDYFLANREDDVAAELEEKQRRHSDLRIPLAAHVAGPGVGWKHRQRGNLLISPEAAPVLIPGRPHHGQRRRCRARASCLNFVREEPETRR